MGVLWASGGGDFRAIGVKKELGGAEESQNLDFRDTPADEFNVVRAGSRSAAQRHPCLMENFRMGIAGCHRDPNLADGDA
jgi:hypothetical protein